MLLSPFLIGANWEKYGGVLFLLLVTPSPPTLIGNKPFGNSLKMVSLFQQGRARSRRTLDMASRLTSNYLPSTHRPATNTPTQRLTLWRELRAGRCALVQQRILRCCSVENSTIRAAPNQSLRARFAIRVKGGQRS